MLPVGCRVRTRGFPPSPLTSPSCHLSCGPCLTSPLPWPHSASISCVGLWQSSDSLDNHLFSSLPPTPSLKANTSTLTCFSNIGFHFPLSSHPISHWQASHVPLWPTGPCVESAHPLSGHLLQLVSYLSSLSPHETLTLSEAAVLSYGPCPSPSQNAVNVCLMIIKTAATCVLTAWSWIEVPVHCPQVSLIISQESCGMKALLHMFIDQ